MLLGQQFSSFSDVAENAPDLERESSVYHAMFLLMNSNYSLFWFRALQNKAGKFI